MYHSNGQMWQSGATAVRKKRPREYLGGACVTSNALGFLTLLSAPPVARAKGHAPPKRLRGFCVLGSDRQGALANGLHGLNPRNTGTRYLRDYAEQPVHEGLRKVYGSSGDNRPVFRVNRGVMRTLGLFYPLWINHSKRGRKRADTLVSPLAELCLKEKL